MGVGIGRERAGGWEQTDGDVEEDLDVLRRRRRLLEAAAPRDSDGPHAARHLAANPAPTSCLSTWALLLSLPDDPPAVKLHAPFSLLISEIRDLNATAGSYRRRV